MPARRVLVIEDNRMNLELACDLLRAYGHEVLQAASALEALALIERTVPDLVLMDIQLPGLDGLALTRNLKENPRTKEVPIIAVTAYAMMGDKEKVLQAGCDGYVAKPFSPRQLLAKVREFLP